MVRYLCLILVVLAAACGRRTPAADDSVEALLVSQDRVAVYDAGVEAYRAERYADARRLWRRSSDLGDHEAASNLGFLFYHGLGGPPDSVAGRLFWREAMGKRDAESHRHVAQAILDGDRELGTLAEGYAHAVAARVLARESRALDSAGVARDAAEVLGRLGGHLYAAERAG